MGLKNLALRFLIKTNVGKILGAERIGSKEVFVEFMFFGSRNNQVQKKFGPKKFGSNYGSTKFWFHKILAPKKILGRNFFKFCVRKHL